MIQQSAAARLAVPVSDRDHILGRITAAIRRSASGAGPPASASASVAVRPERKGYGPDLATHPRT